MAQSMTLTVEDAKTFEERLLEHERDLIALLDWDPGRIAMYVDSRLERDMRAGACRKEPETVAWLERECPAGGALYDVGACSGSYSLIAAALRLQVVAFEPSAVNYRQLCRNAALNRADVVALPLALGPRTRITTLSLSGPLAGAAGHVLTDGVITLGHSVMVYSLDDLLAAFPDLPRPALMKVDTDGSEAGVLEGARTALRLPALRSLMVEVRSATRAAVDMLLVAAGFEERAERARIAPDTWNVLYEKSV